MPSRKPWLKNKGQGVPCKCPRCGGSMFSHFPENPENCAMCKAGEEALLRSRLE